MTSKLTDTDVRRIREAARDLGWAEQSLTEQDKIAKTLASRFGVSAQTADRVIRRVSHQRIADAPMPAASTADPAADAVRRRVTAYVLEFNGTESPGTPAFNDWFARVVGHLAFSLYSHGYRASVGGPSQTVEALAELGGQILEPLRGSLSDRQVADLVRFAEGDLSAEYPANF